MLGYYTAVVAMSCLTLVVLAILVYENGRLTKKMKLRFYDTYAMIVVAMLAEWSGIVLNGAPQWTMGIHAILKCVDYIATPVAGIFFARQVSMSDGWKKNKKLLVIMLLNMILEIVSIFTGWTFYIDEKNFYHHGPFYFVYIIIYCISIVYVLLEFRLYGKQFKKKNGVSLFAIITLSCIGIGLQELVGSNIRTSCLALVLGSVLLFIHFSEFQQQLNDEKMKHQKMLVETDALTGLFSRYAYIETLNKYGQEESLPSDLVVFSIDVNGLKTVNDTLGHEAGDELIRGAAECIKWVFEDYGKSFRTGGDEFVAILRMEQRQMDRVQKTLARAVNGWHGEKIGKLSISIGYALAKDHPGMTVEKMVNVADKMMYENKADYYQKTGADRRNSGLLCGTAEYR